jgi:heme iron utilization protein
MGLKAMSNLSQDGSGRPPVEQDARAVIRRARKAALGTLDAATGFPHVSLVTVSTDIACAPILLLSGLARHTANLKADDRASLLFDATGEDGDPLEGGRVTVTGRLAKTGREADAKRFLDRHPESRGYASFSDFSFYRLEVSEAHYVGGFGRIVRIAAERLLLDPDRAQRFAAAEPSILSHMNEDHSDVLGVWATRMLKQPAGSWTIIACDPEGCDLSCDGRIQRLDFTTPLQEPGNARTVFASMAREARQDPQ